MKDYFSLYRAEKVGLVSLLVAALAAVYDIRLSIFILACFLLICFIAPFLPRFGFYVPIISRGNPGVRVVALTFDDGPDPFSTPELLQLLSSHQVKATFFVTGKRADAYPELIKDILSHDHTIGNHTHTHSFMAFLQSGEHLLREIRKTQESLYNFGIQTRVFRPPGGITNPKIRGVLQQLNIYLVNFSCRAYDGGNRWIRNLSNRILNKIRPGDIILLHDTCPKSKNLLPVWLGEIDLLLTGLKKKELEVAPLAVAIDRTVMERITKN